MWWKKKIALTGSVYFPGSLPLRIDDFAFLRSKGVEIQMEPSRTARWASSLKHETLGTALLVGFVDLPNPPEIIIKESPLLKEEKEEAMNAKSGASLRIEVSNGDILKDRKILLKWLDMLLGKNGVFAVDHTSQLVWSRSALKDELKHEGGVDISALFVLHAVQTGNRIVQWLHTHGLSEIGGYDFDIINPSEGLTKRLGLDFHRAIAFALMENGKSIIKKPYHLAVPNGIVSFIEANEFMEHCDAELTKLRDHDSEHNGARFVLCDPPKSSFWNFRKKIQPSSFLSKPFPEEGMINFSNESTLIMALRARESWPYFCSLLQEFSDFRAQGFVKLGVPTGDSQGAEHMWFEVNNISDTTISGILTNTPFYVDFEKGKEYTFGLEILTDWIVNTPAGMITPFNSLPARFMRLHEQEIRQKMSGLHRTQN